jgi:2-polyprenyl-3-methyl-5-hydroxy-6-metoxy-1,4-benzoquinol methylase
MIPNHWSKISNNPISNDVLNYLETKMRGLRRSSQVGIVELIENLVRNKRLLDIGVVEHSVDFIERAGWRHKQLSDVAAYALGIDILEKEVSILKEKGYNVRFCDATSDEYLNESFDVVHIGDVIEHVNDPSLLLGFAKRHLSDNGYIIVTTPCPFWWRNILSSMKYGTFIGNADHISWITPINALELANRSNLQLVEYHTIETGGKNMFRRLFIKIVESIFGPNELFCWTYVYIYKAL